MSNLLNRVNSFFIDGHWVDASQAQKFGLIDPATEGPVAELSMGTAEDVNKAVAAARAAFPSFSATSAADRVDLLKAVLSCYQKRSEEFAEAMRLEMGAPISFSRNGQVVRGPAHLNEIISVLQRFEFERQKGTTRLRYEPIGVCGLITPWNWPVNQIVVKIAPALAAGCTMVLKPSEYSALSTLLFAEILQEAGVPKGVFNLINGYGHEVGAAIAAHPDVDMVSFTGSTRAGVLVAQAAADSVKRVAQELGGKSANILLEDADFDIAVAKGVAGCFTNSGQSCSIPTRMLVPNSRMSEVIAKAREAAQAYVVGPTEDPATQMGPLVNKAQFDRVQSLIQSGIDEGAVLVTGGVGRPDGLDRGYFVKPTVFANVSPSMTIAREEIFGPVLSIIGYDTEEQAVRIANDTRYGLAAYVQSTNLERARGVARKLAAGGVHINYPAADFGAPFGGYKQSGNGREWGEHGMLEYLEMKSMVGFGDTN